MIFQIKDWLCDKGQKSLKTEVGYEGGSLGGGQSGYLVHLTVSV